MRQYLLTDFLQLALEKRASDLHLSAGHFPFLRIDGELHRIGAAPLEESTLKAILCEIMDSAQQQKFAKAMDIDFAYFFDEKNRFRVNLYHQQKGVGAAFRVIPGQVPTLQSLALPPVFQALCNKDHGLILITGPTGSGKSSSLAALIDQINATQAKHIITIEDPIEFIHSDKNCLITQREVQKDVLSFQAALRAALREDPDVISIAELRDLESIRLALTAAETGHLVLATLHTASAPKTIDRLVDVFPGSEKEMVRVMLSESLVSVVSQRLYKHPEGNGRYAAFEVLVATPAIRHLIRENKSAQIYSAMQTGQAVGMCTFEQSAANRLSSNVI